MMNYTHFIAKLYQINLYGMKLGLQNCLSLNKALGYPAQAFPSIHVAGTNGKGSVVTKIAKALELSGLKVGLYTSPHIACFRERIRINGQMITEEALCEHLDTVFAAQEANQIPATFFEITTFLAFLYFAKEKVDWVVLETGLGGRLDATNIVTPELSVITSISLEHTEILGATLAEIAREKGGIIKPKVPVVIGPRVPLSTIQEIADKCQSPCRQVVGEFANFEEENRAVSRTALETLAIPHEYVEKGLEALPPCRLEILTHPLNPNCSLLYPEAVILDVAHNPDGLTQLFKAIRQKYPRHELHLVFGLSKNKDIRNCLRILKEEGTHFHLVEAQNGRGICISDLSRECEALGFSPSAISISPTIEDSVHLALQKAASQGQIVVICGTFFIMSSARAALGIDEPRDPCSFSH